MSANSQQVGGTHYASKYQHWDFVRDLNLPYMLSQISRYTCRSKKKNGLEDVQKAVHYVQKQREQHEATLAHYRSLTNKFAEENNLDEQEQEVFNMILVYHAGGGALLESMQGVLESMLKNLQPK